MIEGQATFNTPIRSRQLMQLEVEQKFYVDDWPALEAAVTAVVSETTGRASAAIAPDEVREEEDLYFAHPARDFRRTDETLRLRRIGERNRITYKGPKIDAETKTRHELELPLADGAESASQWRELLERLGFRPVASVKKRRAKFRFETAGFPVEISLDEVAEVGRFAEIEIVTDDTRFDEAKRVLADLAARLGLSRQERRSYLSMLLAARGIDDGERI
ncbi:class IV adenylate cyclase [Thermostilla marina]